MKVLKGIVLILISLVFIAYGVAFMTSQGVTGTVLNQEYFRTVVSDYEIPSLVHGKIAEMIPGIVTDGITGGATVADPAKKAAVEAQVELISGAIVDALDVSWLKEQANKITDDLVNSLANGSRTSLSAVIDLTDRLSIIKENIAAGLEKYSDAELMAMFGAPKAYIPQISEKIVDQLGLPSSLVIGDLVDSSAPGILTMVKGYLGTMDRFLSMLPMIIIVLAFLIICILFFRFGGGLKWFGLTLSISGALFLITTSIASNLDRIVSFSGLDLSDLPVPSEMLQDVLSFTLGEMNSFPIAAIVLGLVCFILGLIFGKKKSA